MPHPTQGLRLYGIKACDTMKKARAWLDAHGVAYAFHDYKTAGVEKDRLAQWSDKVGWETLLNRAGTTFKKLPDSDKEGLSEKKALALMLAQPSMIKRPVLEIGGKLLVGFKPDIYAKEVGAKSRIDGTENNKASGDFHEPMTRKPTTSVTPSDISRTASSFKSGLSP